MARISKQFLDEDTQNELLEQLAETIGRMSAETAQHFFFEFFGREEKIMLAKRLAIIALIHEGCPLHRIAIHLHVSETTVGKLCERYEKNEFDTTVRTLTKNKTDYVQFINFLDKILTVGGIMPHRNYVLKQNRRP